MTSRFILALTLLANAASIAAVSSPASVVRPTADLVVVFDTLHAEKAMDVNLWKKIQADKKRAQKRSREKSPFKTDGRDIAGAVNVSFVSFDPFRFTADGLLNVSGDKGTSIREDSAALADMAKDSGYTVEKRGGKKTPEYVLSMDEIKDDDGDIALPQSGAVLTVLDDSQAKFTIRWGVSKKDVESLATEAAAKKADPPLADALKAAPLTDTSLTVVADAKKFASLPLDENEEQKALKELLVQLSTFTISVRVDGGNLRLSAVLDFKNVDDATARRAEFQQDCETAISAFKRQGGTLRTLSAGGEGKMLTIEASLDIRSAWDFLSRFENSGRRPRRGKKMLKKGKVHKK